MADSLILGHENCTSIDWDSCAEPSSGQITLPESGFYQCRSFHVRVTRRSHRVPRPRTAKRSRSSANLLRKLTTRVESAGSALSLKNSTSRFFTTRGHIFLGNESSHSLALCIKRFAIRLEPSV